MTRNLLATAVSLAFLFGLPAGASAQTIDAAPLSQDVRGGQAIATVYFTQSSRGFDSNGNVVDIDNYDKFEIYLLAEYDITQDLTLIFNPIFRNVSVENGDDSSGLGYTAFGARQKVLKGDQGWIALEGTVRIPGVERADNLAQVGSTDTEYDLRVRGFRNFQIGNLPSFVDAQTSYRLRAGDPPNEFHGDLTVGVRPSSDWLILAQSFVTISDGAGQGVFDSYRYHNVQLSGVRTITDGVSLQFGLTGTVAGRNALRERGAFAAVWVSF